MVNKMIQCKHKFENKNKSNLTNNNNYSMGLSKIRRQIIMDKELTLIEKFFEGKKIRC